MTGRAVRSRRSAGSRRPRLAGRRTGVTGLDNGRTPELSMCSGVRERDGVVWLGSLTCSAIGRVVL